MLDLFSGIGGFSLAADSLGIDTIAFCEIDPYPVSVLRRHWPDVPVFDDVKELSADALADASGYRCKERQEQDCEPLEPGIEASRRGDADGRRGLILAGGFPCQDISYAGKGAGLDGERSGLFFEVARLIGELGPEWVLLENVAALLTRGIDAVLGTLASLGYDAVWACIPACAVGAPHRRDRVWIIATPQRDGNAERLQRIYDHVLSRLTPFGDESWSTPRSEGFDAGGGRKHSSLMQEAAVTAWPTPHANAHTGAGEHGNGGDNLQTAAGGSLNPDWVETLMGYPVGYTLPDGAPMREMPQRRWPAGLSTPGHEIPQHPWEPPRLTTVKELRANRLKALGNSIVPQVARLWLEGIKEVVDTGENGE